MELDRAAEDEELILQDQNDAEDARRFILGSGAHAAIDVDADAGTGTGTGSSSPTDASTASAAGGGGGSKKRSKAWDDFVEVTTIEKGKKVRIAAICNHCKQTLSAKSSSSTGHLLHHNCPARTDLPLCFAESDAFQEYIVNAHNPRLLRHLGKLLLEI
jgi:hypothetical protein